MWKRRRETILDVYNLALGARADDWISSVIIVASSLAALLAFAEWEEWASLVLGLWVMASPWLLGFAHTRAMRINLVIGLAIAFMSALELWLIHYDPAPHGRDGFGSSVT